MLELVKAEYDKFFKEFGIEPTTGILKDDPNKKFATMPYIGSKYFEAKMKILFVGLDIGADETPGEIQSFEQQNARIERDTHFNDHIAGTYCAALYLLKDDYGWNGIWEKFSRYYTYMQATKIKHHNDGENPCKCGFTIDRFRLNGFKVANARHPSFRPKKPGEKIPLNYVKTFREYEELY